MTLVEPISLKSQFSFKGEKGSKSPPNRNLGRFHGRGRDQGGGFGRRTGIEGGWCTERSSTAMKRSEVLWSTPFSFTAAVELLRVHIWPANKKNRVYERRITVKNTYNTIN